MIKPLLTWKYIYQPLLIAAGFVCPAFAPLVKQGESIILHDQQLSITPKEFFIANVIDEREEKNAIAWLLPVPGAADMTKTYPVDLQGGGLAAIKQFIDHNLPRNAALRPVFIELKKFKVTETASAGGGVEGNAVLNMTFGLQQGDEVKQLAEYNGSARYTRPPGPPQEIEPTLRQMLGNGLAYFDAWMNKQADANILLAKTVSVTFTDHHEQPEGDSIYYTKNRPLTWDDFKGKIPQSRFAAEVFPVLGYNEREEVNKAVVMLTIDIKVCLPKSACWARDGSRDDYMLNHEQRHFDIAKIAAERFKQKIKSEKLPVGNFDGYINVDYLDAYRDMSDMQKQYDDETDHGTDRAAQERWNVKVDKELQSLSH